MTKFTYVDAVNFALSNIPADAPAEYEDKLIALRAQLEKRHSSGSRKPTKKQNENTAIKQTILNILAEDGEQFTATEIGSLIGASCQRASALLSQLVDTGLVKRVTEGKKIYFKAV